jgi:hypothetical protein
LIGKNPYEDREAVVVLDRRGNSAVTEAAAKARTCAVSPGRWIAGVGAGLLVSLPLGWLLSLAASLPFFLGLFFFALFGLVIGAAAVRATGGGVVGRSAVRFGTAILVFVPLGASIVIEANDFPRNKAEEAPRHVRTLGDRTAKEYQQEVERDIILWFAERQPPGGVAGYLRWIVTSGEIAKGEIPSLQQAVVTRPRGVMWIIRVVLSATLLTFGVYSQVSALVCKPRA